MRYCFFTLFFSICFISLNAQKVKVKGVVKDGITNETIIGATVVYAEGKGVSTDLDGAYSIELDSGTYVLKVSYVGYKIEERKVKVKGKTMVLDFSLSTNELSEVEIVSDIAIQRETPVAFSNVDSKKIQEQLGSQDLPMVLNSTPGVYATSQGGGDGDARISIRGFNSQNVLVLLDGIPMNDMVNGRVYWSNWFGLDNLTRGVQVQRGLGASKLAIPAIGGTMNILTAGIDSKRSFTVKNEYGNNKNYRVGLSYASGRLKKGWAFNFAGSYKRNDGWFDNMYSRMFFYYGKIEKKIGAHLLGVQVLGAPQTSAQRDFRLAQDIANFDKDYAYELGVDTVGKRERGWRYNPSWNVLKRTRENGVDAGEEKFNTSLNHFHKPVFSVKDFIAVNEKLTISVIAYASYGRGYGTQVDGAAMPLDKNGQQNIQVVYDANAYGQFNTYKGEKRSTSWIRKNHNDHNWYGTLATVNYKMKKGFSYSGGLDGRTYKGFVYSTVGDLLGGDLITSSHNQNDMTNLIKRKGDKYVQNIEREVRWVGAFSMLEYKKDKWSGFFNVSSAMSWYKQTNHFLKRQLKLEDTTLLIGYNDVITYRGNTYDKNSEGLTTNQSDWKRLLGFTVKGGANYNITEHMSVFTNIGHLNRVPFIQFVFRADNKEYKQINNEKINSVELGYAYSSQKFSGNFNAYYTIWNNKPTSASFTVNGESISTTATGMKARHMGLEFDAVYKITSKIQVEAMANIADWEWRSIATATIVDNDGNVLAETKFDPTGVKVGDAAQNTFAASVRWEPIKRFYVKPQFNYFAKNFANFTPEDYIITNLSTNYGPNLGRQAWHMPDYYFFDLNAGYAFYVKKVKFDVRGSMMNALNRFYISDAQSNAYTPADYNAQSSSVYVGMGRRWVLSLVATF